MSYTPKNKIIVDEQKVIKEYLQGDSTSILAKRYGYKTPKSINDLLRRNGVIPRTVIESQHNRRPYNGLRLNIINSELIAYYIGLLITDGYVHEKKKMIELTLEDKDVIEFLSKEFGTKYYIVDRRNRNENFKILYRLTLRGEELIEDLKRYNIHQSKTFDVCKDFTLNSSEIFYLPYILRGMIDGDGWVRKDGNEFYFCSASIYSIIWAFNMFSKIGMKNLYVNIRPQIENYHNIYEIRTAIKENIDILKDIIYNKPFGMMRKYNRVHSLYEDVQRL